MLLCVRNLMVAVFGFAQGAQVDEAVPQPPRSAMRKTEAFAARDAAVRQGARTRG